MDKLLYLLPILGCPIMMVVMMVMMRGNKTNNAGTATPDLATQDEIAALRAEIASLRPQQSEPSTQVDPSPKR